MRAGQQSLPPPPSSSTCHPREAELRLRSLQKTTNPSLCTGFVSFDSHPLCLFLLFLPVSQIVLSLSLSRSLTLSLPLSVCVRVFLVISSHMLADQHVMTFTFKLAHTQPYLQPEWSNGKDAPHSFLDSVDRGGFFNGTF